MRQHLTNKLDAEDVRHIIELSKGGLSGEAIGRRYGVSGASISRVMRPEIWTEHQRLKWEPALEPVDEPEPVGAEIEFIQPVDDSEDERKTFGLMAQVRLFDQIRGRLHRDLNTLVRDYQISDGVFNSMVDELLDELADWRRS